MDIDLPAVTRRMRRIFIRQEKLAEQNATGQAPKEVEQSSGCGAGWKIDVEAKRQQQQSSKTTTVE